MRLKVWLYLIYGCIVINVFMIPRKSGFIVADHQQRMSKVYTNATDYWDIYLPEQNQFDESQESQGSQHSNEFDSTPDSIYIESTLTNMKPIIENFNSDHVQRDKIKMKQDVVSPYNVDELNIHTESDGNLFLMSSVTGSTEPELYLLPEIVSTILLEEQSRIDILVVFPFDEWPTNVLYNLFVYSDITSLQNHTFTISDDQNTRLNVSIPLFSLEERVQYKCKIEGFQIIDDSNLILVNKSSYTFIPVRPSYTISLRLDMNYENICLNPTNLNYLALEMVIFMKHSYVSESDKLDSLEYRLVGCRSGSVILDMWLKNSTQLIIYEVIGRLNYTSTSNPGIDFSVAGRNSLGNGTSILSISTTKYVDAINLTLSADPFCLLDCPQNTKCAMKSILQRDDLPLPQGLTLNVPFCECIAGKICVPDDNGDSHKLIVSVSVIVSSVVFFAVVVILAVYYFCSQRTKVKKLAIIPVTDAVKLFRHQTEQEDHQEQLLNNTGFHAATNEIQGQYQKQHNEHNQGQNQHEPQERNQNQNQTGARKAVFHPNKCINTLAENSRDTSDSASRHYPMNVLPITSQPKISLYPKRTQSRYDGGYGSPKPRLSPVLSRRFLYSKRNSKPVNAADETNRSKIQETEHHSSNVTIERKTPPKPIRQILVQESMKEKMIEHIKFMSPSEVKSTIDMDPVSQSDTNQRSSTLLTTKQPIIKTDTHEQYQPTDVLNVSPSIIPQQTQIYQKRSDRSRNKAMSESNSTLISSSQSEPIPESLSQSGGLSDSQSDSLSGSLSLHSSKSINETDSSSILSVSSTNESVNRSNNISHFRFSNRSISQTSCIKPGVVNDELDTKYTIDRHTTNQGSAPNNNSHLDGQNVYVISPGVLNPHISAKDTREETFFKIQLKQDQGTKRKLNPVYPGIKSVMKNSNDSSLQAK